MPPTKSSRWAFAEQNAHTYGGWPRSRRPKNHAEGAPSLLGTGETLDLNWQEEAHGLAGSVLANAPWGQEIPLSTLRCAVIHMDELFECKSVRSTRCYKGLNSASADSENTTEAPQRRYVLHRT